MIQELVELSAKSLIEAMQDPVMVLDSRGLIVAQNAACRKMFGYASRNIAGKHLLDCGLASTYSLKEMKRAKRSFSVAIKEDKGFVFEYEFLTKKSKSVHVLLSGSMLKDVKKRTTHILAVLRDITERRNAERQLKELMKESSCLLGVSELLRDPDKPLDEAFFEMTDVIRQGWQYPDETCVRISVGDEEYESNGCRVTEWKMSADIGLDGTPMGVINVFYAEEKPESDEGPFLKAERDLINALGRQVGAALERRRAEEAVEEQHQWLEGTLSSIGDAVIATDTEARVTFMNPVAESLTGWTAQEAMGQDIHEVFHIINELTRTAVENPVDRVLKEGITVGLANHTVLISRDGREIPLDDSGAIIRTSDGTTLGVVLIFRDITERKKAEEALRESEERLSVFMDSATDAFFHWDSKLNLLRVNPAGMKIISPEGRPEDIIGTNLRDITPDKSRIAIYEEVIRTGEPHFTTEYIPHPKFGNIHLDLKAFKVGDGLGIVTMDITESVQKERLAVLGQLGAGIGHELRNPLGAIKNAAYFLRMVFEEPAPEVKETIDIIEKEVVTSERIISSLLSYARPKPATRRKVDVNDVIAAALSTVTMPGKVEVVSQLGEGIPTILADPDQLRQVFVNLILNAFQAMPKGGRLVVKSWSPGPDSVDVSIADTGVGVSRENMPKLFNPLFTTKAKGIGLGLAIVKTLVDGHDGTIDVQSEPDKGTTFTVRIPVVLRGLE